MSDPTPEPERASDKAAPSADDGATDSAPRGHAFPQFHLDDPADDPVVAPASDPISEAAAVRAIGDEATSGRCLNCAATLLGEYCHRCGQEDEPSRLVFGNLLRELWEEVAGFDVKLLRTLGLLLFAPGRLTVEYLVGRRARYISPFKLYFWVTALFVFFTYRAFYIEDEQFQSQPGKPQIGRLQTVGQVLERMASDDFDPIAATSTTKASLLHDSGAAAADAGRSIARENNGIQLVPTAPFGFFGVHIDPAKLPDNVPAYQDQQDKLEPQKRDSRIAQLFKVKFIHWRKNPYDVLRTLLFGAMPNILIVSVPLLALLMKLFYWRPRRLYVDHLIWALHTHAFTLILIGLYLAVVRVLYGNNYLAALNAAPGWSRNSVYCLALIYHFVAARRAYAQHVVLTIVKGGCLTAGYGCILSLAVGLGLAVTILSIVVNL